ncbi:hypothetical protein NW761_008223 [Fusarium oxysporum]|nr:hypothetical protein NW758_006774 [Fusarium oxysporum]KAJ4086603.1 hypothetical protein NW761_008223 [Fusarium oxysporum]
MCFATPDPDFLEELDRLLYALEPNPVPKCLQGLHFYEPSDLLSGSDNDTEDEGSESMRESMRQLAREERRKARAAESNGTKSALPSSHDHAIKPSSNATEADADGHQANHQKRKRQTEDEEDQPRRKVAKPNDTTTTRPKRRTRPSFKPQASYSPP